LRIPSANIEVNPLLRVSFFAQIWSLSLASDGVVPASQMVRCLSQEIKL